VESLEVVEPRATLLVVTENGYGKRTEFEEYRLQKRGGKGIITIKTSDRNGKVVAAHSVRDEDAIMMITGGGQTIRMAVKDIRSIGRNTQGVRMIHLAAGDKLVSATTVEPDDEPENGEAAEAPLPAGSVPPPAVEE
jgi:DNA gyrase subunit A